MTSFFSVRRGVTIVALTAAWCALWRDISVANIVSGALLSIVVVAAGLGTASRGGVRLGPLSKLLWIVFLDLVKSTVAVAIEILTPTDRTQEAIVAVEVPATGRDHVLLLAVAITLTPGTAVVDIDPDTGTLYLHLLHHERKDATIAHVQETARLACDALPVTPSLGVAR